jgi:geranylgeranyl diphosphate synthase type II
MDARSYIEAALVEALALADQPGAPPKLGAAMRHAVFPGGARIRPRLTMAVAAACGIDRPGIAAAAAAAIELLHCASLVHDDMPEFDNAAVRRGRPSVHMAFGAPLALLAGDALIVLAFQALARGAVLAPSRLAAMVQVVGGAVGVPRGIVAGQAWECEPAPDLAAYQQAKTGALFAAATEAGAAAAGLPASPWRQLGAALGEAYQVADDIGDAVCTAAELGKPAGQDAALGRPNAVHTLGLHGAVTRLQALTAQAAASIPDCPGAADLKALIRLESQRLMPKEIPAVAA